MLSQNGTAGPSDDDVSTRRLTLLWAKGQAIVRNSVAVTLLGSAATGTALGLVRLAGAVLIVLAIAVVATGCLHLGRAVVHKNDPAYLNHPEILELVRGDLRFAYWWIGAGVLLGLIVVFVPSHLFVSLIGALTTLTIYVHGISRGGDIVHAEQELGLPGGSATVEATDSVRRWNRRAGSAPQLPGTRWFTSLWGDKTPAGDVSAYLNATLLAVALTSAGYAGMAAAEVGSRVAEHVEARAVQTSPADSIDASRQSSSSEAGPLPTLPYSRHCPALPDPLTIGHGLGELFKRDGAVQAGCGEPAIRGSRVGNVWMARGRCADHLRSLAVSVEGTGAAMLYGTPAEFAWHVGRASLLTYVQVGQPGGGDVAIVATPAGADVFVRSSPSIRASRRVATRCTEIDDVARPFVHLAPPLAELWLRLIRRSGWAWPVREAVERSDSSVLFIDDATQETVARGGCTGGRICQLDSRSGRWFSAAAAMITIADLAPYMPARVK